MFLNVVPPTLSDFRGFLPNYFSINSLRPFPFRQTIQKMQRLYSFAKPMPPSLKVDRAIHFSQFFSLQKLFTARSHYFQLPLPLLHSGLGDVCNTHAFTVSFLPVLRNHGETTKKYQKSCCRWAWRRTLKSLIPRKPSKLSKLSFRWTRFLQISCLLSLLFSWFSNRYFNCLLLSKLTKLQLLLCKLLGQCWWTSTAGYTHKRW